jgi:CRP/FNR family cyclic AMP-dependent transcriptional regulator
MATLALGRPIPKGLLYGLTDDERQHVYWIGHRRTFRRNSIIYSQGDPSGVTFFVERGMVRTYRASCNGKEFTVGFWSTGEIIGAPDVLSDEPRMLSAEAVRESELVGFTSVDLDVLIEEVPRFARNLIAALSFKARWMMHVSNVLGTHSVPQRVANTLLLQASVHGRTTEEGGRMVDHLSHQDLALLVGASRQRVTQALAEFERGWLIQCGNKRIVLLDEEKLQAFADM